MNQYVILALAIVFSSVMTVSGNICDNAPCEPQINASVGKEFAITLESNPSTGFEWWTKFDPKYLTLLNSTSISGSGKSGLVGVPGWEMFSFNPRSAGNTEIIMLLLRPWENGTIAARKIFPINIMPATITPKQATALGKSLGITTGQAITTPPGTPYYLKNESVMESPLQASFQVPRSSDVNLLTDPKLLARFSPLRFA
jgi:predicted secreted protein